MSKEGSDKNWWWAPVRTQEEVAKAMTDRGCSMSKSRVGQIEKRALAKLRNRLLIYAMRNGLLAVALLASMGCNAAMPYRPQQTDQFHMDGVLWIVVERRGPLTPEEVSLCSDKYGLNRYVVRDMITVEDPQGNRKTVPMLKVRQ